MSKKSLFWNIFNVNPGYNYDYVGGTFVHVAEAKIFGAISLTHVVLADCLGSRGLLQRASQGFCYDNNSPEFCKLIRHSAL